MTQILELKDQNIQRQKISMRTSYHFTFFVLFVETVERLLTIWNDITKLVKYL